MTPNLQKWLTKLLGLDYTIEYKSGSTNLATNALSRVKEQRLRKIVVAASIMKKIEER